MKMKGVALISLVFLLIAVSSSAVETRMDVRQEIRQTTSQNVRYENKQKVESSFNSDGGTSEINTQSLGERIRERVKHDLNAEFASREAQFRDKIEEMQAVFKKEREQFQQKLQTFKDEKKKIIAENVDERLKQVNDHRTGKFTEALSRLTNVLQNLQTKVDTASAGGQNTTAAQSAIDKAKTAIADAQTAVANQASKSYTANVTDETTIHNSMGEIMKSLQADLKTTETSVQSARKSVVEAARAVYQLKIQKNESSSTSSAAL